MFRQTVAKVAVSWLGRQYALTGSVSKLILAAGKQHTQLVALHCLQETLLSHLHQRPTASLAFESFLALPATFTKLRTVSEPPIAAKPVLVPLICVAFIGQVNLYLARLESEERGNPLRVGGRQPAGDLFLVFQYGIVCAIATQAE